MAGTAFADQRPWAGACQGIAIHCGKIGGWLGAGCMEIRRQKTAKGLIHAQRFCLEWPRERKQAPLRYFQR